MKLPRNINGRHLADHLIRHWGYRESRQSGSHILVATDSPMHGAIPIPAHKPLKVGTLSAILTIAADQKQVTRGEILLGL
ncbi:type II toxin-antitoxin system HicA family toxin [Terriglobus sp. RCC_193]|uniref:type II toxin-antitoxin system HicA family toxin n=1 Tax=Terriglobus sp. RCC_193 TaxID=3239218 RepID=UPI0035232E75